MEALELIGSHNPIDGIGDFVGDMPFGYGGMSLLHGFISRRGAESRAKSSITFDNDQLRKKIRNNEELTALEIQSMYEYAEQEMRHKFAEAEEKLEEQREKDYFKSFSKQWLSMFAININTVIDALRTSRLNNVSSIRPKLLFALTNILKDFYPESDKADSYVKFCNLFKETYQERIDLDFDWLCTWKKGNRVGLSPMSDAMNFHFIAQGLPVIIVFPMRRGDYYSIEVASWGFDCGINSFSFTKFIEVACEKIKTVDDMQKLIFGAASYFVDCYNIQILHRNSCSIKSIVSELKPKRLGIVRQLLTDKYVNLFSNLRTISQTKLLANFYDNEWISKQLQVL